MKLRICLFGSYNLKTLGATKLTTLNIKTTFYLQKTHPLRSYWTVKRKFGVYSSVKNRFGFVFVLDHKIFEPY